MEAEHDAYVIARIEEALARDERSHKQDVRVAIESGVIRLSGQTSTTERRDTIGRIVELMVPDRVVRNDLVVIDVAAPGDPEVIHD